MTDMRAGQLVAWLGDMGEDMNYRGLGDIEDEELLAVIERFRQDLSQRHSDVA